MAELQLSWQPQEGPQASLVDCPVQEIFYGGARGGGKGSIIGSMLLTPFGWKKIESLRVGSAVCATDGSVQRIIGYYPRGVQPVYRLRWSDGSESVMDSDHIWLGWLSNKSRKIRNERVSGEDSAQKWLTSYIYAIYQKNNNQRLGIPVISAPCAFNVSGENKGSNKHISRELPAYLLGVLLGDGSIGSGVNFTSGDPEIPERVGRLWPITVHKTGDRCPSYGVPSAKVHLQQLGLMGCKSNTKFIPRIYLFATVEERWELLRGLMDTDGWADKDGDCYYSTVSAKLRDDVRHLARSLGAIVTVTEKHPTYTHNGEKRQGQKAFSLRIKINNPERLFFLKRKQDICRGKQYQSMAIWLSSIERAGELETICVAVSHPNNLYVTDDFIVTHNTDGMIGKNAIKANECGKYQRGIFIRKELPQLEDAIERCKEIYFPLGWKWGEQKKKFVAPNGATLLFRPLERLEDAQKQQGKAFSDIYFEELTNYKSADVYNRMRGTNRSAQGIPCQLHGTGNPGGPGHHWVKERFIDPNPVGMEILEETLPNGNIHQRVFIPAKLADNQILVKNDPNYENNLYLSGSKELVRAWLLGDWNIVDGAFFDCWSPMMIHRPFLVPGDWTRIVSFDWGSSKPFSVGWWAIVADDYKTNEGVLLPRGYALRYKEWYGKKGPDLGLKMTAEAVGDGIRKRTSGKINDWVADPAIFKEDGGPSQAERMKLPFRRADNTRVANAGYMGGWDLMRSRMIGTRTFADDGTLQDDGVPMIGCFNTCVDSMRTIPVLQHDPNRAEDLNTSSEDHAADDWRYFCSSRPWREKPVAEIIHLDMWGRHKHVNNWKTA